MEGPGGDFDFDEGDEDEDAQSKKHSHKPIGTVPGAGRPGIRSMIDLTQVKVIGKHVTPCAVETPESFKVVPKEDECAKAYAQTKEHDKDLLTRLQSSQDCEGKPHGCGEREAEQEREKNKEKKTRRRREHVCARAL